VKYVNCQQCGARKKPPAKHQAGVSRAHYESDRYCSRLCCEKAHGIVHKGGQCSVYQDQGTVCAGCGGPFSEKTAGCTPCRQRHQRRVKREAALVNG
jgi:hypothetical protein